MGELFECEIQARMRDINLGGHVDSVEAIRVVDEARLLFLRFARLDPSSERTGVLAHVPDGVSELVGAQRVDYNTEMRFVAFQPFLMRIWVSHVGRSSFTVATQLRVEAGHDPALAAETSLVLWDHHTQAPWPLSDEVRAQLETYRGEPVTLRERP